MGSQPWLSLCAGSGLLFPPQQRPIQCFPRQIMVFFCSRMDSTHGKHPDNILFLRPARLRLTPNPPTAPAAPSPALLPVWAAPSFPFPGMWVSPQGWECPRARRLLCQDGRALGDAAPPQEPRLALAVALPPCTTPATPVGKALLSSQALIAELATSQLGQRQSCSLLGGLVIHHGK